MDEGRSEREAEATAVKGQGRPGAEAPGDRVPDAKLLVIKKYANRRLYHTGTSAYVTLDDLAALVKDGVEFVVTDARTGEDLTRSVLAQIIFEQEGRGASLLPVAFLRQLIGFYDDSTGPFVPGFLEASLRSFGREQEKLRERMSGVMGLRAGPFGTEAYAAMEEQTRRNMAAFTEALRLFTPFAAPPARLPEPEAPPERRESEIEALRREMDAMRARVDRLTEG